MQELSPLRRKCLVETDGIPRESATCVRFMVMLLDATQWKSSRVPGNLSLYRGSDGVLEAVVLTRTRHTIWSRLVTFEGHLVLRPGSQKRLDVVHARTQVRLGALEPIGRIPGFLQRKVAETLARRNLEVVVSRTWRTLSDQLSATSRHGTAETHLFGFPPRNSDLPVGGEGLTSPQCFCRLLALLVCRKRDLLCLPATCGI
mmetsp:Transcript_43371/g.114207  ORF Transcript_43371/g.114207 Transcript_43371/m.114207 type:complete len:202 (+) Transcript_43371:161-766(+)